APSSELPPLLFLPLPPPPRSPLFPYTTLFRSRRCSHCSRATTRNRSGRGRNSPSRTDTAAARDPACCSRRRASSAGRRPSAGSRSEEHTSELQSLRHLVCRLLLEKKKAGYIGA